MCTEHVRDDKIGRTGDRSINMCLGCEIDDRIVSWQHVKEKLAVDDVALDEAVARISGNGREIVEIPAKVSLSKTVTFASSKPG